jgi:hypothetical protein
MRDELRTFDGTFNFSILSLTLSIITLFRRIDDNDNDRKREGRCGEQDDGKESF